jgi:hypothetical protein
MFCTIDQFDSSDSLRLECRRIKGLLGKRERSFQVPFCDA